MKLHIIVPVSPNEPKSVVERSVESLSHLDHGELTVTVTYVVDISRENDERVEVLRNEPVSLIIRRNNRGHRAGAINDALDRGGEVDYIALFDVDSRPSPNFLVDCVKRLVGDAVIASGPRYITNMDSSMVTRMVSVEYNFLNDIYRLFEYSDSFKQFNGLIGVINAKVLEDIHKRFDEGVSCEDVDMTQRIYLEGMTAAFVKSAMTGEQAAITLTDYYQQRLRWMTGAYEGLRAYSAKFWHADIPMSRKMSWFLALTTPLISAVFIPFIPVYALYSGDSIKSFLATTGGLFVSACITMVCSWHALINQLLKRGVEWKKVERSDI